jgi:Ca2+-binding RTX toxin-like protein
MFMTTEIISTDVEVTGFGAIGRLLGGSDLLIIREGGSLTSIEGRPIEMSGDATLRVEGMVFKLDGVRPVINTETSGHATIDVAATGVILMARENRAIFLDAPTTLSNAGTIQSVGGRAIEAFADVILTNSGQIRAADWAVTINPSSAASTVVNSGRITGGTGPGDGSEEGHGIQLYSATTTIMNTGTIEGLGFGGDAIRLETGFLGAATIRIENHGTLRSQTAAAIDGTFNTRDGLFLLNTGLVVGATRAIDGTGVGDTVINHGLLAVTAEGATGVRLGEGGDTLRNHGVIETRVDLGTGGDVYDGRGAEQGGYILGSTGNDNLRGGAFDDSLYGGDDNDRVFGGAGDDEMFESAGLDSLFGGAGDDVIGVFGVEAASMSGGAGDDTIEGSLGADTLWGGAGDDSLNGGGGNDRYGVDSLGDTVTELATEGTADVVQSGTISLDLNSFANIEQALLTGLASLNLAGNGLANTLSGNAGANRLAGNGGADRLEGGSGADTLSGGLGTDRLIGGAGADRFVFASAADAGIGATSDRIDDFFSGFDRIDLSGLAGTQVFRGALALTGANQVRYDQTTGTLSGSTDADRAAEWSVSLAAGTRLVAGDLLL